MSFTADPSKIPHELLPPFEQELVRLCCVSAELWERAGRHLVPELLGCDPARDAMKAIHELCKEGRHPGDRGGVALVAQRVNRWSTEDGRIPRARVRACYEYLTSAPGELGVEEAVREVRPTIERHYAQLASKHASQAVVEQAIPPPEGQKRAADKLTEALTERERIGKRRAEFGRSEGLSVAGLAAAREVARLKQCPFGIAELDAIMGGGPRKGQLGFGIAHSGQGKSTLMTHWACRTARNLDFAIVLSGEVIKEMAELRVNANLTGCPWEKVRDDDRWFEECQLRLQWLLEHGEVGPLVIEPFVPNVTKIGDLWEIVEYHEARLGRRADVVILDADEHVDYSRVDFPGLDELARTAKKAGERDMYSGFGLLYAYLSFQAKGGVSTVKIDPARARCVGTVSQVKGEPNPLKFKLLVGEEAAESKRKVRIVDWGISANWNPAEHGTVFHLFKGRFIAGGSSTPALPRGFECAQMVPIKDDPYPWVQDPKNWKTRQGSFWK